MVNEMLEATKKVFENRKKELPDKLKWTRDYFEEGCLCIDGGDLPLPVGETDEVAVLYYIMWCGCSRHFNSQTEKDI